jgi:CDP-glycerol glycerophosphotransferase
MDTFKKIFFYGTNSILYWLANIIPKNKNIWIFGAWFGNKYSDNSRYLFEYINHNHPEIRAIWLTDNLDIISELKNKNYEVYKRYSIKSILLGLRAKYSIFVQTNLADCMAFLNNKYTSNIQLWHGIPLKKIGTDDSLSVTTYKRSNLKEIVFPFLKIKYSLIISASTEDQTNFSSSFKGQYNLISITGYPRNDLLFRGKVSNDFIITYLPTFRDSIGDKIDLFSDYNFNVKAWNKKLLDLKIILNIKLHPVNKPKDEILVKFKDCQNINFLEEVDVAEVLPNTDILITDYSSVYFDFLLTDSPIIFAPFDYEKYITKDRELYYNYDEVTPGPKCKDWNDVLAWIEKFKNDPMLFLQERNMMKDKFHKYQDENNSERVYLEIKKFN